MANNDLVRVEFGTTRKPDDQTVYKELNSIAANIIGTAYKGPAFIPQVLFNRASIGGVDVRNNFINKLGTHRQNMYMHLYDGYTCNAHSDAYDAASTWFVGGGEYAYFTRVLGIGSGIKSETTGKMLESGFNLSKNISSGTLDHKTSDYPNANSGGDPGSIGFVLRNITEIGKSTPSVTDSNPTNNLDYFYELGIDDSANILTDVVMFASGVLPEMSSDDNNNNNYSDTLTTFNEIEVNTINSDSPFINLRNFNPKNIPLKAGGDPGNNGGNPERPDLKIDVNKTKILSKDISYIANNINQFPERFYEKGHLRYTSYPLSGFSSESAAKTTSILISRDYSSFSEEDRSIIPDYNSFESEYQTAKTPWVTSQPLNREGFGQPTVNDNRQDIHNKVDNLFRFWSLDDGEIGNRFRIKINPKRCGDIDISDVMLADDEDFATFDLYIFEYDARVNEFYDTKAIEASSNDRVREPVEEYIGLNLNPNSLNYIGRVIGTTYEYYDFDADKIVKKGKYENKSNYLRVEIVEDIESLLYSNQHMLIPSGFRSYPHIRLKKEAFAHYTGANAKGINLAGIFDTFKIYQLPPLYALNYYKDNVLPQDTGIENNWGVVFTPAKVDSNSGVFTLQRNTDTARREVEDNSNLGKQISPHYYYSKYFLSGISKKNKNNQNIYSQITLNEGENIPVEGDVFTINVTNKNDDSSNFINFIFKDGVGDNFTQIQLTRGFRKSSQNEYHILINSSTNSTDIIKAASNIKNLFSAFDSHIKTRFFGVNNLFDIEVNENVISIVQTNKDLEVSVSTSDATRISVKNYSDYNVWIEEDNYLNSFFHLEKIVIRRLLNTSDELSSTFNLPNKSIVYKHSGGEVNLGSHEYINLDRATDISTHRDIWTNERNIVDKLDNKLSFDFFTYGGFDGIDIRDSDKRFFKNDAIIRELHDENETKSVYTAYNKAIDIATDSGNADTDIIVVPGIKEIPIIRKCIDICEDTRKQFFIADVSGACSSVLLNFTNQTIVTNNAAAPIYADTLVKTSLGVMGDQFILDNQLEDNYNRDKILIRDADDRFLLTHTNVPQLGDSETYYNYRGVIEGQFESILSLWPTFSIQSKYFMPVLGDISAVDTNGFNKKVCPEVFALGIIASSSLREDIVNRSAPVFLQSFNVSMSLISNFMNESGENFNLRADRLKNAIINPIYRPIGTSTIKMLSQNTAYEIRGSLFKDQGVVRTIQQIKKRIMYNIFLDESIVSGGVLFTQNANIQNLYDKITIQLNNLLSRFVEENLITDYKLRIPRAEDDKTIIDMQNYILRGNIILQLNNSDIISLGIDNILNDLSLLSDPDESQIIQLN